MHKCTKSTLEDLNGAPPKDESIWKSPKHPDIRQPIQNFFFKTLHGTLRVSDFWRGIPNCRGITESIEHIILDCPSGPSEIIWHLAKLTWPTSLREWPEIHLGTVLGCGSILLPAQCDNQHTDRGHTCFLQILISESAHLIWVL